MNERHLILFNFAGALRAETAAGGERQAAATSDGPACVRAAGGRAHQHRPHALLG